MDVPLEILDRDVARAAAALRRGRAQLERVGPALAPDDPLRRERGVSTRSILAELSERAADPLAAALRDWVLLLTLERVTWTETVRVAAAWHEESIEIPKLAVPRTSGRAVLAMILREPARDRSRALADGLCAGATSISDATRISAERRAEAERLLGQDDEASYQLPVDPTSCAAETAEAVLDRTEVMARALPERAGAWTDALPVLLGKDAAAGWPAHLGARWVYEIFRPTRLTDGIALELDPWPAPLGAASFARALARFGGAFAEADAPRSAPFVLAHPPFDLRPARRAALYGSLVADAGFGARILGLGRDRAREQARVVARSFLLTLRLDAARVLSRGALLLGARDRADRFEGATARALGAPVPAALAGVVPRLAPGDATRLMGAVLAAADRRVLIERFDEDWWRSPHAAEAIRAEHATLPPSPRASREALLAGLDELVATLGAWLN